MRVIFGHIDFVKAMLPLLTAAWLLTSCSGFIWEDSDGCEVVSPGDPSGGILSVELDMFTPSDTRLAPTRGKIDDGHENMVADAYLLVFLTDGSGNPTNLLYVLRPDYLERDPNMNSLYHASYSTTVSNTIKNKKLRVGILANASHIISKIEPRIGETSSLTYDDVRRLLVTDMGASSDLASAVAPQLPGDKDAPFVMWGMPHDIFSVNKEATIAIESCLMRDVARFDIALGDELKKNGLFDFRSVYFYKPSSTVSHVPDMHKVAETVDEANHPYYYSVSPCLDAGNNVFYRWEYPEEVENGEFKYTCYVPEGEVVMKGKNGGVGKPRDVNHTERPAVVVGGYYNGSSQMSFYRIDICNEEGNLVDILRNHLYNIVIRSVLGPGQPTPDEAYDSNNVMVVAQITDWCMVDRNVMYNGADWITVTKRVINLTGEAGAGTTFIIGSSVPLDEWEFKLGEEGDFSKQPLLESDRFFVTRPIQETGSKILVVTKRDLPAGESPVTERLYVRIGGRVLFWITLVQYPRQGDYWFIGDYFPGEQGPWQPIIYFPVEDSDPDFPTGSFTEFLKWLFGGDFSGSVGEGDHISDPEYINSFFWKFLAWFFTDEYGHVIGGSPEDWDEAWDKPLAIIVFDLFKWMLGPDYYREVQGPQEDPNNPDKGFSTVGPAMAVKFMEWFKILDFIREIEGPADEPYDPSKPDYSGVGAEVLGKFISWMQAQDFWNDLSGFDKNPWDDGKDDKPDHTIDTIFDFLDWFVGGTISGSVGNDKENPDDPDTPSTTVKPIEIPDEDPGWGYGGSFEWEIPVTEDS